MLFLLFSFKDVIAHEGFGCLQDGLVEHGITANARVDFGKWLARVLACRCRERKEINVSAPSDQDHL